MDQVVDSHYMSLRQIKNEIVRLQNNLEYWCNKKKINYQKTQPQSFKYDKIKVDVSHVNNDPLTMYMVKDEECDDKIFSIYQSLLSYQQLYLKEIKRLTDIEPYKIKVYELREDSEFIANHGRKRTWLEISEITNYSDRQVQRIYKEVNNGKL